MMAGSEAYAGADSLQRRGKPYSGAPSPHHNSPLPLGISRGLFYRAISMPGDMLPYPAAAADSRDALSVLHRVFYCILYLPTAKDKTPSQSKEIAMSRENNAEIIRGVLGPMGYDAERISEALRALEGEVSPPDDVPEEQLLTPTQVCRRLNISRSTLVRGDYPFLRVGVQRRYSWREVRSHLHRQGPRRRARAQAEAEAPAQ